MAVLGSGGHTAEMLALLKGLDPSVYTPRDYVIADTDHTSATRVEAFERSRGGDKQYTLHTLPRSREVGQSYLSSVFTTLYALLHACAMVLRLRPSLLLCNGPGTCIPVAAWCLWLRFAGVKRCTVVYVESIARVDSLSLSGKILVRTADRFLVQWPQLAKKYKGRAEYIGRVC